VAIALVLLIHTWRPETHTRLGAAINRLARVGWTGVDLFFVLSGFLITGILLDALGRPGSYRDFFARRALRIVPLYGLFLVVSLLVLPAYFSWLGIARLPRFGNAIDAAAWPWFVLFAANLWMARENRFAYGSTNGPTWSLAIEEQFYLLWPWFLRLCRPGWRVRAMLLCMAAACAARTVLLLRGAGWLPILVLTPCRVDALAAGGLVAAYLRSPGFQPVAWRRLTRAGLWLCLPTALLWVLAAEADARGTATFQVFGYTWLALGYAGLLGTLLDGGAPRLVVRWCESRPLVSFGKYSYGIYLFHLMIFAVVLPVAQRPVASVLGTQVAERCFWMVAGVAGSWGLAYCLYHLYEVRFLRLKTRFRGASGETVPRADSPAGAVA
jgi:peptidoglycan/LPS O-acetylase OafA/YrhL